MLIKVCLVFSLLWDLSLEELVIGYKLTLLSSSSYLNFLAASLETVALSVHKLVVQMQFVIWMLKMYL